MRRRLRPLLLPAAAAVVLGAAGLLAWSALRPPRSGLARVAEGWARPGPDGVPELALTSHQGGYQPNLLHATAGQPLRLTVRRPGPHACSDRLLVPDLGVSWDLPASGQGQLLIPAAPRGSYLFTCGARMVKGVLVFE